MCTASFLSTETSPLATSDSDPAIVTGTSARHDLPASRFLISMLPYDNELAAIHNLTQRMIEIKRVLESLYGFEVDEVQTLNMDEKKKKRGRLLIAKPDYKKAYVTLRNPLSISPYLYSIRLIEEERKNMSKQSKSSIVEGDETKKICWLDRSGVKKDTGYGGRIRHETGKPLWRHQH